MATPGYGTGPLNPTRHNMTFQVIPESETLEFFRRVRAAGYDPADFIFLSMEAPEFEKGHDGKAAVRQYVTIHRLSNDMEQKLPRGSHGEWVEPAAEMVTSGKFGER